MEESLQKYFRDTKDFQKSLNECGIAAERSTQSDRSTVLQCGSPMTERGEVAWLRVHVTDWRRVMVGRQRMAVQYFGTTVRHFQIEESLCISRKLGTSGVECPNAI